MKVKVDGKSKRRFIRRMRILYPYYAFVSRRYKSNLYVMNERLLWTEAKLSGFTRFWNFINLSMGFIPGCFCVGVEEWHKMFVERVWRPEVEQMAISHLSKELKDVLNAGKTKYFVDKVPTETALRTALEGQKAAARANCDRGKRLFNIGEHLYTVKSSKTVIDFYVDRIRKVFTSSGEGITQYMCDWKKHGLPPTKGYWQYRFRENHNLFRTEEEAIKYLYFLKGVKNEEN